MAFGDLNSVAQHVAVKPSNAFKQWTLDEGRLVVVILT